MDPLQALLIGVVAPGAVALLIVFGLRRVWRREDPMGLPAAAGIALAAGFALAFALILGVPDLPPVDVTQVAPWVGLALAPFGFLTRGRGIATAVVGGLVGLFLTWPLHKGEPGLLVAFSAAIALTFVALERGLDAALAKADPRGGALAVTVLVAGAAAAILFSDIASLAQVTGGLAAATGAVFTLGLWRPAAADLRRAAPVVAGVLATNLWSASLYANGRYEVLALIALAPLVLASLLRLTTKKPRALLAIARPVAFVVVPVAVAAALAGTTYFATSDAPIDVPAATAVVPATGAGAAPAKAAPADGYDPGYGY